MSRPQFRPLTSYDISNPNQIRRIVERVVRKEGSPNWEKVRQIDELAAVTQVLRETIVDPLKEKKVSRLKRKLNLPESFDPESHTEEATEDGEITPAYQFAESCRKIDREILDIQDLIDAVVEEVEKERHAEMLRRRALKNKDISHRPHKRPCPESSHQSRVVEKPPRKQQVAAVPPAPKEVWVAPLPKVSNEKDSYKYKSRTSYCHHCESKPCKSKTAHAICRNCDKQGCTEVYPIAHTDRRRTRCYNCDSGNFATF